MRHAPYPAHGNKLIIVRAYARASQLAAVVDEPVMAAHAATDTADMKLVFRCTLSACLWPALAAILVTGCAGAHTVRLPGSFNVADADFDGTGLRIRLANGRVVRLAVDEYVSGSVPAEAALGGLDQATARAVAEVQAIVARTYAFANRRRHAHEGYDLCATTHCQVYRPLSGSPAPIAQLAKDAARNTSGMVVTYADRPINAVFHADCGGHTSDAGSAWRGESPPYLLGMPDSFCVRDGAAPWRSEVSISDLRRALNRHDDTNVGRHLENVEITERDAAGRAVHVTLHGARTVAVRGEHLRSVVNASLGPRTIKSTRFTVIRDGRKVLFEGRGFGHGVGLCQTGAMARARSGHAPRDIIAHYYPGTAVANWHTLPRAIASAPPPRSVLFTGSWTASDYPLARGSHVPPWLEN